MAFSVTIRPLFGRVLSVVTALMVAFTIVNLVSTGSPDALLRYIWPLLLLGYLVWIAFWNPRVDIDERRVRMVNVFRTIDVPFTAIQRLDTRFALTAYTGEGRFVAWAAPAPGRHRAARTSVADARNLPESSYLNRTVRAGDVPRTDSGDAATVIRGRLEELAAQDARGETGARQVGAVVVRLHVVQIVVVAVLAVATAVGALV